MTWDVYRTSSSHNSNLGGIMIVIAGGSFAANAFIAQFLTQAGVSAEWVVVARVCIAAAFFTVISIPKACLSVNDRKLGVINAMLLLASLFTYFESIAHGAKPAQAVALMYLYPLWTLLLSRILQGTKFGLQALTASIAGATGAALTTGFWAEDTAAGAYAGFAFAGVNGMLLAMMVYIGRSREGGSVVDGYRFARFSFLVASAGAALYVLTTVLVRDGVTGASPKTQPVLVLILLTGLVGTALPYLLIYVGAPRVGAVGASILLLSEPLIVVIVSLILYRSSIAPLQLFGIVLILAAGAVAFRAQRRPSEAT